MRKGYPCGWQSVSVLFQTFHLLVSVELCLLWKARAVVCQSGHFPWWSLVVLGQGFTHGHGFHGLSFPVWLPQSNALVVIPRQSPDGEESSRSR